LLHQVEGFLRERHLLVVHGAILDRAFPADDVPLLWHVDLDPKARVGRACHRGKAIRHDV
jgi:hypothetical protein